MSHGHDPSRELDGELLTAYGLDAATSAERAAVARLLADPAAEEARAHVAEVRVLAAALKAARDADLPERSPDLRQAVLAAAVGHEATPAEPSRPARAGWLGTWSGWVGSQVIAGALAASLMFLVMQSPQEENRQGVDVAMLEPAAPPRRPPLSAPPVPTTAQSGPVDGDNTTSEGPRASTALAQGATGDEQVAAVTEAPLPPTQNGQTTVAPSGGIVNQAISSLQGLNQGGPGWFYYGIHEADRGLGYSGNYCISGGFSPYAEDERVNFLYAEHDPSGFWSADLRGHLSENDPSNSSVIPGAPMNAYEGAPWFGGVYARLDCTLSSNFDMTINPSYSDATGFGRLTYRMGGSRRRNVPDQMEQPMLRNESLIRAHSTALGLNNDGRPRPVLSHRSAPQADNLSVANAGICLQSGAGSLLSMNMNNCCIQGSSNLSTRGSGISEMPDPHAAKAERYSHFADSRFLPVTDQPLSTFSIDVDTASYTNVRRFLTSGQRPPVDAVRIEEFVNYFRYDYPQPKGDDPFSVTLEAAACPWQAGHRIVRVGIKGRDVRRDARPAGNLVFLVDVSGSMNEANKLPLVKQSLSMLVDELTANDRVAMVVYAGNAGLVLPSTSGDQKDKIRAAIQSLEAGGSTHGSAGINLAYEQAAERFIQGGANRVILCTDGDLNVGVTSDAALVELIKQRAAGGTFLTVLGFGQGNLQDEKMEKLADNGNGVYAYIDGVREARKVLVEQLTGSTITIAKDVKIQVEFNPAQVASYRLLGYENRVLAAEDFRDDKKDAGEIGAGHTVTALYEIVPVAAEAAAGAAGRGAEPLKYQPAPPAKPTVEGPAARELLTVKLRWKKPEGDTSTLTEVPLADKGGDFAAASTDLRFATAVAAFGMILRDSVHKGTATLPLVAEMAGGALGDDAGGYRAEFLDLVRRATAIVPPVDRGQTQDTATPPPAR